MKKFLIIYLVLIVLAAIYKQDLTFLETQFFLLCLTYNLWAMPELIMYICGMEEDVIHREDDITSSIKESALCTASFAYQAVYTIFLADGWSDFFDVMFVLGTILFLTLTIHLLVFRRRFRKNQHSKL